MVSGTGPPQTLPLEACYCRSGGGGVVVPQITSEEWNKRERSPRNVQYLPPWDLYLFMNRNSREGEINHASANADRV